MTKTNIATEFSQVVDTLNQALKLEYSLVINYPRLASAIRDNEARRMTLMLGSASIHHADTVADAITVMGGTPNWSFEPLPSEKNIVDIFKIQLEKEELALQLHKQSVNLVNNDSLKDKFCKLADEEKEHIELVNRIISRLG
jgi:bacterioferritin